MADDATSISKDQIRIPDASERCSRQIEEGTPAQTTLSRGELSGKPLKLLHQFIDANIQAIRYSSVALAALGIALLAKNVHLTSKFSSLQHIPAHFVSKHVTLQGRVHSVSAEGVLNVDHIPIVKIWKRGYNDVGCLPIQLALVDVREEGSRWMQQMLPDQHVWFKLLTRTDSSAECVVWTKEGWRKKCLNESLVAEGRAVLHPWPSSSSADDAAFDRLRRRLLKAQKTAEKKELGLWKQPAAERKFSISYIKHLYSKFLSPFQRK